jgi:hypothetical protein
MIPEVKVIPVWLSEKSTLKADADLLPRFSIFQNVTK